MSMDPNPYASGSADPYEPTYESEPIDFAQVISRGIRAANRTLVGAVLIFAIVGPIQILSTAASALIIQGGGFQPPAQGAPPTPQMFAMMGLGCFSCVWFPIMLIALPWASGGIYGQLLDRIVGRPVGALGSYGKKFYVRMLLLMLMYVAVLIVLMIPVWITGAVLGAGQMQGGQFDPVKIRELSRHPLNVVVSVLFGLGVTAAGTVMMIAQASSVTHDCRTRDALRNSWRYIGRQTGEVLKLFFIFVGTAVPMVLLQQIGNFLTTASMLIMLVVGFLSALYVSYLSVLNPGIVVSAYAARHRTG